MLSAQRYFASGFGSFLAATALSVQLVASDIDSSALQKDSALVLSSAGQVSTEKKGQDWAIGAAERIWVTKPIVTGADGYARFQVAGGTTFEVFAHSRLTFRKNPGNPQDLLDVATGHIRVQVQLSPELPLQTRVLTPAATILIHGAAAFAIAVDDEDNTTRIDVQQGEIIVQHALLPRSDPVLVKAGDAISVQAGEPLISRRLDRGSLYHFAIEKVWKTLEAAVPGHNKKDGEAGSQMLAANKNRFCE